MTDAPRYYVLGMEDPEVGYRARLEYERDYPTRSWMSGERFERPPPEPIVLALRGTDEDDWVLPELWLTPITIMSLRLLSACRGAGVDTFDTYAVELHDPVSGKVHKEYVAFNITRKIAAADHAKTKFASGVKERMISADIDELALDYEKTQGALLFRLAESVNVILMHDRVCEAVLAAGIDSLTFYEHDEVVT